MTPNRSVWDRHTDGMQYAAGLFNALVFCAVIYGAGWRLLTWAMP